SGTYSENAVGGGIAAFYGGDMEDLAEYYTWSDSEATWKPKSGITIPSRIAKGVDRMDGSGYRAGGSLWWDNLGNLYANGNFTGFLSVGVKNGQRIELDPAQKAMNIFGADGGLVATHSGRILKVSEAQPTNTAGSNGTASVGGLGTSFSSPSSKTLEGQICSGTAGNSGVLVITVPVFMLSASASGGSSTTLLPLASIALYLVVTVGADTMRYYLGGVSSSGTSETAKTTAKSYRIPVPKGSKYTAKLVSECRLTGPSVCTGTLGCSSPGVDYDLTTQAYRCEYGANGWVISTDSKNYAYLIVENGTLHFKVVSNGTTIAGS
ncbi:MAG: hypothetical protein K2J70_06310, partial [Muribaculaceae bacterium]|nr:hypothetical protein [Muribaculaceae bacterium]